MRKKKHPNGYHARIPRRLFSHWYKSLNKNKRKEDAWRRGLLILIAEPRIDYRPKLGNVTRELCTNLPNAAGSCRQMANVASPASARVLYLTLEATVHRCTSNNVLDTFHRPQGLITFAVVYHETLCTFTACGQHHGAPSAPFLEPVINCVSNRYRDVAGFPVTTLLM